jgi:acyl-CoA reductase-like NAD-dependent aldehyde dehydrogenase
MTLAVIEPATEAVLAEIPRAGARALRVARAVEAGVLSINSNTSVRVSTPFGGFKQSGVGRELGPHALEHYTELKSYYATGD